MDDAAFAAMIMGGGRKKAKKKKKKKKAKTAKRVTKKKPAKKLKTCLARGCTWTVSSKKTRCSHHEALWTGRAKKKKKKKKKTKTTGVARTPYKKKKKKAAKKKSTSGSRCVALTANQDRCGYKWDTPQGDDSRKLCGRHAKDPDRLPRGPRAKACRECGGVKTHQWWRPISGGWAISRPCSKAPEKGQSKKLETSKAKAERITGDLYGSSWVSDPPQPPHSKPKVIKKKTKKQTTGAATARITRVEVPAAQFYKWRDEHGDWPDKFPAFTKWIKFKGKKYWPLIVMQHSMTALEGAKLPARGKKFIEFLPVGGPIKAKRNPGPTPECVACTRCRTPPGQPCTSRNGKPHKARVDLFNSLYVRSSVGRRR